ncbi:hypothetical protein BBP40_000867 [Aspergillus hancockii]|nr:hypothetical protein BBP40_000867 [Aspergillus hancockii]
MYLMQRPEHVRRAMIASTYDSCSEKYDDELDRSEIPSIYSRILSVVDLAGSCLDLGSGTGALDRFLIKRRLTPLSIPSYQEGSTEGSTTTDPEHATTSLTGIEISTGMAEHCRQLGAYSHIYEGSIQDIFPKLKPFDHIVSVGVLCYVTPEEFSLIMAKSFQLARKTISVTLDEVTEHQNNRLREMELPHSHMTGYNHVSEMERTFCNPAPVGWNLIEKFRQFGWSPFTTGVDTYMTAYVFEQDDEGGADRNETMD